MSATLRPGGMGTLAHPFYTGLSDDQRPALSEGASGTLFELDTGKVYAFIDGVWTLRIDYTVNAIVRAVGEVSKSNLAILAELRSLRMGMQEAGTSK